MPAILGPTVPTKKPISGSARPLLGTLVKGVKPPKGSVNIPSKRKIPLPPSPPASESEKFRKRTAANRAKIFSLTDSDDEVLFYKAKRNTIIFTILHNNYKIAKLIREKVSKRPTLMRAQHYTNRLCKLAQSMREKVSKKPTPILVMRDQRYRINKTGSLRIKLLKLIKTI